MYVAILQNTFIGQNDPYGMFNSEKGAWDWIESEGITIADYFLWSVHEVKQVNAKN